MRLNFWLANLYRRLAHPIYRTSVRRRLRRPVEVPAVVESLESRRMLTQTITVNTLSDVDIAGKETLRDAVAAANADPAGSADTINFAAGLTGTITLTGGDLQITNSMQITGPGSGELTISANNASPIFDVDDGLAPTYAVTISGLTLTQGANGGGTGGAVTNFKTLTLTGDVFSADSAVQGGGAFITRARGF